MSINVFVTGGAGYIGSHITRALLSAGHRVIVYDNLSYGHQSLLPTKAVFIKGDTRNLPLLEKVLSAEKIDSIIHLAALKDSAESVNKPAEYYSNNFEGTCSVLKACQSLKINQFIFSSTAAVYAPLDGRLVSEESPLGPSTPYGRSKLMSEQMIQDYAKASDLRYIILRYFNVAGASLSCETGPMGEHHTALLQNAVKVAVGTKKELTVFGDDYPTNDGTGVRDYIHVDDLAELHVRALEQLQAGKSSEILNCGYGHGYSVKEVIESINKSIGYDMAVKIGPKRAGDLASVVADCSKLKLLWDWKAKNDNLHLICKSALDWERSEKLKQAANKLR